MAVASVPFACSERPLFVIVAFTLSGSLLNSVPCRHATLFEQSRAVLGAPATQPAGRDAVLVLALVAFLAVAALEILALATPGKRASRVTPASAPQAAFPVAG